METDKKQKRRKFFSELISGFKPIVRGVVKSIPLGNVLIEIIDNAKGKILNPEKIQVNDNTSEVVNTKPHQWRSIIFQLLIVSAIIYALYTRQIDINQFINLIQSLLK